ncbi:5-oxoprolinase [Caldimicrobium thiodismutans]|uniref:5-oxoprolinase n=1 Tax=Caldimicrobium thiodismutans TaxID=1653476 RepID=A0A0U5AKV2_9BACT|nr:hydantoinase/oxoprolinase family protein [Caldimicrobium thiodismutans]BAU22724.1 5-oxoprolinase [Caldimicrobium thiodismutans]
MKVAVDTGGTFTDFVWREEGALKIFKISSTPRDPALAILKGLEELEFETLIHGTTVATNAFLERKGEEFVLLTTAGFEDIIFIGRQTRPKLYDLFVEKPKHFITPENVFGVKERIGVRGEIIRALEEEEIKRVIREIKNRGLKSVALSFLHSYINPIHEKMLKESLEKELKAEVSASFEILPEFREYERTSTTAINSYLVPVIRRYLETLKDKFPQKQIFIQQSNGGFIDLKEAQKYAIHTILSGPAGGVYGALIFGKSLGFEKLITFDMGGTSTDVCLIDGGLPFTKEYLLDSFPVGIPVIDIHTVGAGGGSIAYVDAGGVLKVGPQSAGADPGPACYGRGFLPTVTDANLVLGRILPERFYGGKLHLDKERSLKAISEIAQRIGLSPFETALGIIKIANTHMARAISKVSVERGFDPREFVLFTYGGSGGLHACALARDLGIPKILVPKFAGAFSAFGLYFANLIKDFSQTVLIRLEEKAKLRDYLSELKDKALRYLLKKGENIEDYEVEIFADLRYLGQGYELTVPFGEDLKRAFEEEHAKFYGYVLYNHPLEVVTLRLRIRKGTPFAGFQVEERTPSFSHFEGKIYTDKGFQDIKIINWEVLKEGESLKGPALIIEDFTTLYLEEDFYLKVLKNKTLLLERIES